MTNVKKTGISFRALPVLFWIKKQAKGLRYSIYLDPGYFLRPAIFINTKNSGMDIKAIKI